MAEDIVDAGIVVSFLPGHEVLVKLGAVRRRLRMVNQRASGGVHCREETAMGM